MTNPRGCVVVGGGLAAATLVQTLREGGFAEPLTLIGEESDRPYERPALSKDYLQGKTTAGDLYVHPEDWYTEHQVQTRFGQRRDRDRPRHLFSATEVGETVGYSQLVLATGASPRTLSLPGIDLAGVHTLRRIGHAEALRDGPDPRPPAGDHRSGLDRVGGRRLRSIGRMRGDGAGGRRRATVPRPRERLGRYFTELHRRHGVDLRTGTQVHGDPWSRWSGQRGPNRQ